MFLLRLATKNVFRKSWRSLITATPVLVGVMMTLVGWGLINGIDQAVIIGQIRSDTGHFRIFADGYLDTEAEAELDHLVEDPLGIRSLFPAEMEPRLHPRLSFRGELSDGRNGLTARGIGIEPETYFADFFLPIGGADGMPPRRGSYRLLDVHGAGAQRSDPKTGDAGRFPRGRGPQGDVIRIDNFVRCVRDAAPSTSLSRGLDR